ncbi:glycoside hydrolase superfamily [Lipomyces doorenjongii]|uniref:glycoside hydrolase superfamily n=1 Tax=Lipomyces doorenjongii TaxID=383834 RepID=UPI0034CD33EB
MAPIDIESVLSQLTTSEKIKLLSGIDSWHTYAVRRLGVPSLRLSDGPNGVRGTRFFNGVPAACFPCGTALGATWNTALLTDAGGLMGVEGKAKGAHVILGPTVNMQRSPLGGRAFESFSEDPTLSGLSASAIVKGIQSENLVATIKHFVGNDQEHERHAVNAIISHRALREIYLLPFQIAIKESQPGAIMSAYNKVNGRHVSDNPYFLDEILRRDWAWKGLIMSDWFGVYSTADSVNAGLDLEMPGPTAFRGDLIQRSLNANTITQHTLDDRVRNVLKLVDKAAASGIPEFAPETTNNTPTTSALLRQLAAESIVVLKNESTILPLGKDKTTAVIGPNAKIATFCGGGSASLLPYYTVSPFDGIKAKVTRTITYVEGCTAHKMTPMLGPLCKTASGKPGVIFRAYPEPPSTLSRTVVDEIELRDTNIILMDYSHPVLDGKPVFYADVIGYYMPDTSGVYEFGLTVYGTAKLYVNDKLVVDNETVQRQGEAFFNNGTIEEIGKIGLEAGTTYEVKVEFGSSSTCKLGPAITDLPGGGGLRIGVAKTLNPDVEIKKAVEAAKLADQVILTVGLSGDWESEGYDRTSMKLPGATDSLVDAVLDANPNTVVVVQSGTPVEMPWISKAKAVVEAWYGGNETGNGIADILFGDVNPSGRLPLSFPIKVQDNPAYLNYRSERGRTLYGEDIYIGYRYYEAVEKDVLFPFGHGLSYSTFEFSDLAVRVDSEAGTLTVKTKVTNVSGPAGAEVVQVYIHQHNPSIGRPPKELKGFSKVTVAAGKSETVEIVLEINRATSFWDETENAWISEKDTYDVLVGASSADIKLRAQFATEKTVWWNGL